MEDLHVPQRSRSRRARSPRDAGYERGGHGQDGKRKTETRIRTGGAAVAYSSSRQHHKKAVILVSSCDIVLF